MHEAQGTYIESTCRTVSERDAMAKCVLIDVDNSNSEAEEWEDEA